MGAEKPAFDQGPCAEGQGWVAGGAVGKISGIIDIGLSNPVHHLGNPPVQRVVGVDRGGVRVWSRRGTEKLLFKFNVLIFEIKDLLIFTGSQEH